jgi:hypothetical protein
LVFQTTYLAGGLIGDSFLLLNIVKNSRGGGADYKACCIVVEDFVCLHGWFDGFDEQVCEVADFDKQRDVMREHHGQ